MKSNIDLTENRMFSSPLVGDWHEVVQTSIRKHIYDYKFPWQLTKRLSVELSSQENAVVITGDRETRREVAEIQKEYSGNYCACCGARIGTNPWDKEKNGLCHSCNDYYSRQEPTNDKCLWRKTEHFSSLTLRRIG